MTKLIALFLTFLAGTPSVLGQVTITGKVISREDHSPLPGATVVEKGTQNGTTTAQDGTFSLRVTDPGAVLVFSFIGMISQEYPVNGQGTIFIKMKADCHRDYFDAQRIGIYANSGVIHTPAGGQLEITFPAVFGAGTLTSGVSFQTNLGGKEFLDAQVGFLHFAGSCNFDADVKGQYRSVSWRTDFNAQAWSLEADLNFYHLRCFSNNLKLIVGCGKLDFQKAEPANRQSSPGPLVGVGTWIGGPLGVLVVGKAALYKDKVEYQGLLSRDFKRISTFIKFYKINSFTELSLGIGTEMVYRFKKKKR